MRAQMQDMDQKFMAELRKKKDQLKEMCTKKIGSLQQRSMVKRIKQKSRKQAHDPDFEYQPMTKAKEDTRNKTQTAADVPKPTEGTDEEKEKKSEKKKEEIETKTEPATEPEQKEGAHEAKQQQKEKIPEDIGRDKTVAAETNPKEHANQEKTQFQVLESDDDFKEESIQNKPLAISCRKTNKVIDAFSEKKLALQPTIEEFEKNDLAFARNSYAGRYYVFSTLINRHYDSLRPAKDCHNKHFEIAKEILS
ncbi:nucleolar protein 58-like [Camellia sinensis]|uniref:nucleolar protein 58-like n=1 Tax=Camellia sinensis TaxID=4442 RepID=UPI001036E499|nr:nucleolar protein 58-like [Camellia sinensis]